MALLAHGYLVEPAGNGGWIVAPMRGVVEPVHAFAAFTTGADLLDWLRREHEEIESQAKSGEGEDGAAIAASPADPESRLASGRTDAATSESGVIRAESSQAATIPISVADTPLVGLLSAPGGSASDEISPFILSAGPIHFAAPENLTVKPDDWPDLPETLRRASC